MSIDLPPTEILLRSDFYVTGGTLKPDAPSYIERDADKQLCERLLNGEFCYVLTSRQMGKSSLMVRTVRRLREDGVAVAVLDLTAIGQNLTIDQWYDGLISRLGQQLKLEDELECFWNEHAGWGPLQRWTSALENVVLKQIATRVVIFIDEIDMVRSLPFSTDEFFAGIRECYNRRAHEPAFNRLAFSLLGVAAPSDLIRDTRMTPFNIGHRIELNDFTPQEAAPLAKGLGADEDTAQHLLSRVLYWTGGHPYLTQRLCRALSETIHASHRGNAADSPNVPPILPTPQDVDRLAEKLFLSRQARDRDDNLIFVRERLLRNEVDVPGLLLLYRRIHVGELVTDDETNPLITILRLSGIARGVNGFLQVRNRIYRQVFDLAWIQTNMPAAEVRRQRRAGQRGMIIGFGIAAVLLSGYLFFGPMLREYRQASLAREAVQNLPAIYGGLKSYRDSFEVAFDVSMGETKTPVSGAGTLLYDAPDKANLSFKSGFQSPPTEVRLLCEGPTSMLYVPSQQKIQILNFRPNRRAFELPVYTTRELGPACVLPLFRLLLLPSSCERFLKDVQDIRHQGYGVMDGQPARIVSWQHDPGHLLGQLGINQGPARETRMPVTAWLNASNNLVLRLDVDLSMWAHQLVAQAAELPVSGLVVRESHRMIQIRGNPMPSASPLRGLITGEVTPVDQIQLPQTLFSELKKAHAEFARLIPARLPFAPPQLVDLSAYYNAAFAESWHPGVDNNTLDMLSPGILMLGGTAFDARGIVQLSGKRLPNMSMRYPRQALGIRVGMPARQLHFLHGTGWSAKEGTRVGTYIVHYADGTEEEIPIVYGEEVRDWNASADPVNRVGRSSIVWRAKNDANFNVRLFKFTWLNPNQETSISSIDFISSMADPAPFLIALTAEP